MVVKTITITENAYNVLKSKKDSSESFSEVIVRVFGKRPLSDFIGILSEQSADKLEKHIREMRKRHTAEHKVRIKRITAELSGEDGSS